jgi:hypothetical protein
MIKSLFGLLKKTPGECAAKQSPGSARKTVRPGADFRAVTIAPSGACCTAAKQSAATRYLMREAPRLPLAACTMAADCSCKFRKVPDRREGDRRLFGGCVTNRWYSGAESRKRHSRRQGADLWASP